MNVMPLLKVDDAVLTASNIPETDAPFWAAGTTFGQGAWTIAASPTGPVRGITYPTPRLIYQSRVANNLGQVPRDNIFDADTNPTGEWIIVRAPNRWQPFDWRTADRVIASGDISYTLTLTQLCTAVSFHNMQAASVTVSVREPGGAIVWSAVRDLTDTAVVGDWFEFLTWEPELISETIITGMPGYAGWRVEILLSGTNCRVGQIALGRVLSLGTTVPDSEIGFDDLSGKQRDEFGSALLVPRGVADTVSFRFFVARGDERRVKRAVAAQAGKPAVWFAGERHSPRGTTIFGFNAGGLRIPLLEDPVAFATLEIEDLT